MNGRGRPAQGDLLARDRVVDHMLSRSADARTTEPIGSVGDSITP
jgi:hypothetical protein